MIKNTPKTDKKGRKRRERRRRKRGGGMAKDQQKTMAE